MRVCIRRGCRQIGGSCVEVESQGQRIALDIGLPLDAPANHASLLPQVHGQDGTDPELLAILISHPHLDHYGLLAHVSPAVGVGMGPAARRLLAAAADFVPGDWPLPVAGWDYESGRPFAIGPFTITPYLVDHSAYEAYALLIEADGKRLFYSGDFRGYGRKSRLFRKLLADPPSSMDALLVEGSSLGRLAAKSLFPTEADIEAALAATLRETAGLALVHCSTQNIDRIVSIHRATRKIGRTMVVDPYAAAVLDATRNRNLPQSHWRDVALFVPEAQRRHIKKHRLFELLAKHPHRRIFAHDLRRDPSKFSMLFRPLHCIDLERAACLSGARYVYSQWEGYWQRGNYERLGEWIEGMSIPRIDLHTSGHASPADLEAYVAAIAPQRVVPIHTFRPELYPTMFERVEPHADGEWWSL